MLGGQTAENTSAGLARRSRSSTRASTSQAHAGARRGRPHARAKARDEAKETEVEQQTIEILRWLRQQPTVTRARLLQGRQGRLPEVVQVEVDRTLAAAEQAPPSEQPAQSVPEEVAS